jgi:signal transduction histidine kinase
MVTHELRAPLSAVEGYLTAYLTGAVGTDPTVNRQMLERAGQRTHSLLDLVSDLLQYSRLESRRVERTTELLDLSEVIVSTVELMRTHDQSKEMEIKVNIAHPLPPIEANRQEMEQVFTNLVSNAIKYNVKKGRVEITAQRNGEFVQVKVADTGIGIDKENLPCIFDEFFRVAGPETRYTTGTGLGLSIVKRIVDACSGRIEVESEPGKGTIFTVQFPVRENRNRTDQNKRGRSHGERT